MPPVAAERLRSENEPFRLLRSENRSNGQGASFLSLLLCRWDSREIATSHDFPCTKRMDDDAGRKAGAFRPVSRSATVAHAPSLLSPLI